VEGTILALKTAIGMLFLILLFSSPLIAQGPDAEWMTLETAHFRVHYPADYQAWTLRLVPRLEAIHAAVMGEAGYAPTAKTDILVMDPLSESNGEALPFLKHPRIVLWTSPPEPGSSIGHFRDSAELIFLHEDVHVVHLSRPGRSPWAKFQQHLVPFSIISMKTPRWVSEGYATYLEGKMTGVGRPNGDFRAAILRQWALQGKLPSYARMDADLESWMGMSMAYLMGSAYLEWLVERADEGALKRLWARLTARSGRSFDEAFEGVFGEEPAKLYDRFTTELTWRAMELERRMKPDLAGGELWADLSWTTGEPALSPDGTKMAVVVGSKDGPSRLQVWQTSPDQEAEKRRNEAREKTLKRDPEDVAPVQAKPFPRKVLFTLPVAAARKPTGVRWLPDGKSLLFVSYEPDTDGFLSPDLFLWTPETGEVRRATKGAAVREADPFPDGKRALAVQNRFGFTRLAVVNLDDGGLNFLTEPSLDAVYAQPQVSPDGSQAVVVKHEKGRWALVRLRLTENAIQEESPIGAPEGSLTAFPAWSRDGRSLFASIGANGFVDIYRSDPDLTRMGVPVTRMMGAALGAEPDPNGDGLYFLSLEPDGLDIRYLALKQSAPPVTTPMPGPEFAPAIPLASSPGIEFKAAETGASRPYGAGRQEYSPLVGGAYTAYAQSWQVGVRGGDVLGRLNYFAVAGAGHGGAPEGGTLAFGWRALPVALTAQAYAVEERPSAQSGIGFDPGTEQDAKRRGIEATAFRSWTLRRTSLGIKAGALFESRLPLEAEGGSWQDLWLGFVEARIAHSHPWGAWEWMAGLEGRAERGDREGEAFSRLRGEARTGLLSEAGSLVLSYERRQADDTGPYDGLRLGGVATTLLPESARYGTILSGALPENLLLGDRSERWRADVAIGGSPAFFYERNRLWTAGGPKGEWLSLAGFELSETSSGPLGLMRLPGIRIALGGAYIFDAPLEGKARLWLSLSWTP